MYKLEGLIDEKTDKLVWKKVEEDGKWRWWNEETNELISTFRLNRLKNRNEFINLWGKY